MENALEEVKEAIEQAFTINLPLSIVDTEGNRFSQEFTPEFFTELENRIKQAEENNEEEIVISGYFTNPVSVSLEDGKDILNGYLFFTEVVNRLRTKYLNDWEKMKDKLKDMPKDNIEAIATAFLYHAALELKEELGV